tara:strand:+ start:133 stop:357 length:225 start_codon:yes stop_codon:yes gene_type:complete
MNKIEEYLKGELLLKENGEPDNSIFGVKLYKNKKAAKISKEFYKKASAWKNDNGETLMFFGAALLHFVDKTKDS